MSLEKWQIEELQKMKSEFQAEVDVLTSEVENLREKLRRLEFRRNHYGTLYYRVDAHTSKMISEEVINPLNRQIEEVYNSLREKEGQLYSRKDFANKIIKYVNGVLAQDSNAN